MIADVAASLAAASGVLAVGAIGFRADASVLARMPIDRSERRRPLLEVIGSLPIVRRVPLGAAALRRLRGSGDRWSERELGGAKALASVATAALCLAAGAWPLALPMALLGWRLPDVWLSRLASRRVAAADREVPVLLDLLALATSAGLPPQAALRLAIDAAEGPLADELRSVIHATELGGRWRDELPMAAGRLALPDLDRLVAALTRAEALGSSLADEMEQLAVDVRERRRAAATERARAAPVKMLFPLVFLVLPAFLLLTVVPVLVATVESIR